jgi:hypothetical protein
MTNQVIPSQIVYTDDVYNYVTSNKSELVKDHPEVHLKAVSGLMMHNFIIKRLDSDNAQVFYLSSFPLEGDE